MEQLILLEQELVMLQENIQRIKEYRSDPENQKYRPHSSRVVGEFKHRVVSLKQRLTLVSSITTYDLFENIK